MSVSAEEPFVVVFVPCLVELFYVCDMYCVLLLSNGFFFHMHAFCVDPVSLSVT